METLFALCDANNFYLGAETAFRPDLRGRPVVALSNNDSCAVARSDEAKALGIAMGAPWFEIRHFAETHGLVGLSSNYPLYADMSSRLMSVAAGFGPRSEVYSIDEIFISCTGIPGDLVERGRKMRARIYQWTGLPTCIGIGQTKTLAKLANHVAKAAERKPGSYPTQYKQVFNLAALSKAEVEAVLLATDVEKVWGVGRRIGAQLRDAGIANALDLANLDPALVRATWSVVLERTVRELQGLSCIALEDAPPPKNEIASTRSFGHPVHDLQQLVEAISVFASRAAEKARKQNSHANKVMVFAHTSPFRQGPRFSKSTVVPLRFPTSDTTALVSAAVMGIRHIFAPGYELTKAGVMLLDLQPADRQQHVLDFDHKPGNSAQLMTAMDAVNKRFGRGTLHVGSTGATARAPPHWAMKQDRLTPQYTTRWEDVPVAKA